MVSAADPVRRLSFVHQWSILGLLTVLLLVFITPPFQVPDEPQHFFRAYQLSEGKLLAEVRGATAGGMLPSSLQELSHHFLGTSALHTDRPVRPTPLGETFAQFARPLDVEKREFIVFTGAAAYGPLAYAPQVLGLKIGTLSDASVLATFYLSRIINGLCTLALLAWALWLMPWGRELAAFAALLPMATYLYASGSPDAMIIASAYLYTALVFNRMATDTWSHRDSALAFGCALTICMTKPVYVPLFLFGFVQILSTRRRLYILMSQGGILLATGVVTLAWGMYAAKAIIPVPDGISIAGQIQKILHDPFQYLLTLGRSLLWREFYYKQIVGTLGWLSFELPKLTYWLPAVAVVLALGGEKHSTSRQNIVFVAMTLSIIGVCVALVLTALYVSWTPVGAVVIEGVQGRYFLPLLPLGLLAVLHACARHVLWRQSIVQAGMLGLIALEAGTALYIVATKYSVLGS